MTRDIDLVIEPTLQSIDRFVSALDRSRYYVDDAVDAVRRRQAVTIGGVELFIATAEDTVLAKLEWRLRSESEQQFRDVVAVLSAQDLDMKYLQHWAGELGITSSLSEALAVAGRR